MDFDERIEREWETSMALTLERDLARLTLYEMKGVPQHGLEVRNSRLARKPRATNAFQSPVSLSLTPTDV